MRRIHGERVSLGAADGGWRGSGRAGPGSAGTARSEPLKGHWSLPGGLLELGEPLIDGVMREVREETGLTVEPIELIELLDRIHREEKRVRYHYVIADYLCRVSGGALQAASDAEAVRWVERAEWNSHSALRLDPVTVRVIEAGWQRAQARESKTGKMKVLKRAVVVCGCAGCGCRDWLLGAASQLLQ